MGSIIEQAAKTRAAEVEKLMWWETFCTSPEPSKRRAAGKRYERAAEAYEIEADFLARLTDAVHLASA